jgi:hypothetical protein
MGAHAVVYKTGYIASVGAAVSIASQQVWIKKTTATGLKGQGRGDGQRKASRVICGDL